MGRGGGGGGGGGGGVTSWVCCCQRLGWWRVLLSTVGLEGVCNNVEIQMGTRSIPKIGLWEFFGYHFLPVKYYR